jgi:DNA-binding beta-propeller fold protein YncE
MFGESYLQVVRNPAATGFVRADALTRHARRIAAILPIAILLLLVTLLLAACGGGGDGTGRAGNAAAAPPSGNTTGAPATGNPKPPVVAGTFAYVLSGNPSISAYAIDETTGALSQIPGSPFVADNAAEDIVVTPSGKFAYVAHNSASNLVFPPSKSIWSYTIDPTTGALTHVGQPVDPGGFPTSIAMHPSGRAIFVAVRGEFPGGSTEVHHLSGYAIDATTGLLTSFGSAPLNGWPSIITIDPAGKFAYVATQDAEPTGSGSGFISVFAIDAANGSLSEIPGSPYVTIGWVQKFGITPDGRFAYAAGHALAGYAIDAATGALSELPGSPFSQSQVVTVHPSGRFAYGQEPGSDPMVPDSVTYAINESTGVLSKIGSNGSKVPYALALSPSGKFIYGSSFGLSVNAWDSGTGMLTHVAFLNGSWPNAIATTNTYR